MFELEYSKNTTFIIRFFYTVLFAVLLSANAFAQDSADVDLPYPIQQDNSYPYSSLENGQSNLRLAPPENLRTEIKYNTETGEYDVVEKTGAFETGRSYSLTPDEYASYRQKQDQQRYWNERSTASMRGEDDVESGSLGNSIFGSNVVDIKPQGSAELTFGLKINTIRNPSLAEEEQRTINFDFDNKIRMNVTGSIGDKLSLTMKYDTESQFEFDKKMKLEYTGDEDEIIKKFEMGNVSFPSQNSLITGSLSSFGFKSELQFGKLYVTSVFARQQGEFSSISVDGGAQTTEFEIRADEYDRNRHYFLGHFFRNKFEEAFETSPEVSNGITIEKVEVWVQQSIPGKEDERDIVALSKLGEYDYKEVPTNISSGLEDGDPLYLRLKDDAGVRDVNTASQVLDANLLRSSLDYKVVAKAVPLKERQYIVNRRLGFISLNSPMDDNDVLGVAVRYSYKGKTYQIGEFSTEVDSGQVILVKMLKSSNADPSNVVLWDLMMKNVYSTGGYQISSEDFTLDVLYEDDATGVPVNYIKEGNVANEPLISVFNLDNMSFDHQPYPDGMFDYVEGVTVYSKNGRIIFPVLEPFGKRLEDSIGDPRIAEKYVFTELYDSSWSKARQIAEKNKFLMKGEYKSSVSSEIPLNRTQVSEGSVIVKSGGRTLDEGADYTVDYTMGRVKIENQGLLESGAPIKISFENDPVFNTQTKTIFGSRFEYRFNENFQTGLTYVNLSEIPMYHKVSFQDFPVNNTMWGLDGTYSTKSNFLTTMVDKIPLIETKAESNITLGMEYAQLVPHHSEAINDAIEIDYFENSQHSISLKTPSAWSLASIPADPSLFPESAAINDLESGKNRAHLSWYNIHTYFYTRNANVSDEVVESNYSRGVYEEDLFPNKDNVAQDEPYPIPMLNLAYYPDERGMYNFDYESIDPNTGKLINPEKRWGGIMRNLTTTDFEEANVEFIEFWMMDPFTEGYENNKGGDFYINLGMVSEDILKDSRQFMEHALLDDENYLDTTVYSKVSTQSPVIDNFDPDVSRLFQDVGFDGMNDNEEMMHFDEFVSALSGKITNESVLNRFLEDPAGDDFVSYLDKNDDGNLPLPDRYKYYNGVEGNSPEGTSQGYGSIKPDKENIDDSYTFSNEESFFQYQISIRPEDLRLGENFITDTIYEEAKENSVKWYHFKIPISSHSKKIGGISDFRSISFIRLYMHDFAEPVVLRFAEFDLVRSDWRKYEKTIFEGGEYDVVDQTDFDVSVVNIEENAEKSPVNYVLPPGVERVSDNSGSYIHLLNEQSLALKVVDLDDGYGKAVYKQINKDFRQFGKVEMYVHAEEVPGYQMLEDEELRAFVRLGADYTNNYYEYEVPLKITPEKPPVSGGYDGSEGNGDRLVVWPDENNVEIDFDDLIEVKDERNAKVDTDPDWDILYVYSKTLSDGKIVRIKGNPNLGNVKTMMMGVKNPKKSTSNPKDDGSPKSCEVWFNELRLTEFDEASSWAATASSRVTLADFASLSFAGKTSKPGFGSIDQRLFERSQEDLYQYDFATNVALGKFTPEQWGISIPFYYGISETFINPLYDPLNPDKKWEESLLDYNSDERDSFKQMTQDYTKRTSFNFTNVRIQPKSWKQHPLSISNFSATYGYSYYYTHNIDKRYEFQKRYKAALKYNYSFKSKPVYPFKKMIKAKELALIRDFNFYYTPASWGAATQWDRAYQEAERRNINTPDFRMQPTWSKKFQWTRNYQLNYNLSKSMKFSFSAVNLARIDEPEGRIVTEDHEALSEYREEVWHNFWKFGNNTQYNHQLSLNWKVPINKVPMLDWTSASYKYSANYDWTRGAELRNSERNFGNVIKNGNSENYNLSLSFSRLYNKSKYLKEVSRLGAKRGRKQKPKMETVKYDKNGIKLTKDKPYIINHRLGTDDVKVNFVSEKGTLIKGKTEVVSTNKVRFTPSEDSDGARLVVTGKKEQKQTAFRKVIDHSVYGMMMVKNISLDYTTNAGTILPGYLPGTTILGQRDVFNERDELAPGWHFITGGQDENFGTYALSRSWLTDDEMMDQHFQMTDNQQMRLKASLEPIRSLRVTLNSSWSYSENFDQQIINPVDGQTKPRKYINGNYSRSCNTLSTAFDDNTFQDFLDVRQEVAAALTRQKGLQANPVTGFSDYYNLLSQDVLLHSFRAAYAGQKVRDLPLEFFPSLFESFADFVKTLNWRVTYSGLSRIKSVKKYFKSININHAYSSTQGISRYEDNWGEAIREEQLLGDGIFLDYSDEANPEIASEWEINATTISERFSPLIGIDMRFVNNISAKFEIRKTRNLSLSFLNQKIQEVTSDEFVIGLGYVVKNVPVTFFTPNSNSKHQSDINIRGDFSIRDNLTTSHDITTGLSNKISGQKIYTFKSSADYDMTKRFKIRLFYDHVLNRPQNSFNTSNVYFGMTFRFSLS